MNTIIISEDVTISEAYLLISLFWILGVLFGWFLRAYLKDEVK